MKIDIYNKDCFDFFETIEDKSVNLILIDPPYNINKADWDIWPTNKDYYNFMDKVFDECSRVLKDNGSFFFFHSNYNLMSNLNVRIQESTEFVCRNNIIWTKPNFRANAWKNPSNKNKLRSWFPNCEYINFYVKDSSQTNSSASGLYSILNDQNNFKAIRKYFNSLFDITKLNKITNRVLDEECFGTAVDVGGGTALNMLSVNRMCWRFPSRVNYEKFIKYMGNRLQKEVLRTYDDLVLEYDNEREACKADMYVHKVQPNHNSIWEYKYIIGNGKHHPTTKPQEILKRIIETSSNKGDLVLDCFSGSGSTAVACQSTGRNFIGCELDEGYYKTSLERLKSEA